MTRTAVPAPELIAELADLLAPTWPEYRIRARASGLVAEGEGGGNGGGGEGGGGEGGEGGNGGGQGGGGEGGQGGAGGSGEGGGQGGEGGETVTMPKAELDSLRQAVASANQTARDLKRQVDELKSAGQSEEERNAAAAEKLTKVTAAVTKRELDAAITAAAERLNYASPSLAASLIDRVGLDVNVDLDGDDPKVDVPQATLTIIEDRLKAKAQAHGELLKPQGSGQYAGAGGGGEGGSGGQGGGHAAMNDAIRRAAGRA